MPTNHELKAKIIEDFIHTPEGRAKLVMSMGPPMRMRLDHMSAAHRLFGAFPGDKPATDEDIWVSASATPEISQAAHSDGRPDIVERSAEWARTLIHAEVTEKLITELSRVGIEGPMTPIEGGYLFMNARDYTTLRGQDPKGLEGTCERDLIRHNIADIYRGATILVSRLVPELTIYSLGRPEDMGCYQHALTINGREDLWKSHKHFTFDAELATCLRVTGKVITTKVQLMDPAWPEGVRSRHITITERKTEAMARFQVYVNGEPVAYHRYRQTWLPDYNSKHLYLWLDTLPLKPGDDITCDAPPKWCEEVWVQYQHSEAGMGYMRLYPEGGFGEDGSA